LLAKLSPFVVVRLSAPHFGNFCCHAISSLRLCTAP
jgi:hypothetical protein